MSSLIWFTLSVFCYEATSWYSCECVSTDTEENNCWKKVIFVVFFAHKVLHLITVELMSHRLFQRCPYNHSGPWTCLFHWCLCRVRKLSDLIRNNLICVLKINEDLKSLKLHQGNEWHNYNFRWTITLSLYPLLKVKHYSLQEQINLFWILRHRHHW